MTTSDLEVMLQDSGGVEVVHGGVCTWGHEGVTDEQLFEDVQVVGPQKFVKVVAGVLTDLSIGDAITVGGTDYEVKSHQRLDEGNDTLSTEGVLTMIFLRTTS